MCDAVLEVTRLSTRDSARALSRLTCVPVNVLLTFYNSCFGEDNSDESTFAGMLYYLIFKS